MAPVAYSQLSIDLLDPYSRRLELLHELLHDEFASNEAGELAERLEKACGIVSLAGRVHAFADLVSPLQEIALSATVPLRHRVRLSVLREEALHLAESSTARLCELNSKLYDRVMLLEDRAQVLRLAELRNRCFNEPEFLDQLELAIQV